MSSVFLCIQYLSDVALFIVALMPDHRERDFTRIPIVLQGSLADTEPTAYGFIVEPFLRFGRTPDKPFDTVDEICKGGAVLLPCLRSMMISFIALLLITLLILSKRAVFLSIALLVGCKSNPSKAEKERVRKNKEIVRKQGKW